MNFKWAFDWMGKQRWKLVVSIILGVIGVALMTIEPYVFSAIVDDILMPQKYEKLIPMLGLALGIGVAYMATRYLCNILAEQAAQNAVYRLKSALFKKLMKQSGDFYAENRTGDLINKCSGDVEMVNFFLCWCIPHWVDSVLMVVFALIAFLSISPLYTAVLFAVAPFSLIVATKLAKTVRPAYSEAREQLSKLNTVVQENISGNRVVKAFVREDYELGKFQKENQAYKDINIKANMIWLKFGPVIDSLASIMTVLNLTVGGVMVVTGNITLGQLTLFLGLAWALNEPMITLGHLINSTQRFLASQDKIRDLYYSEITVKNPETDACPEKVTGHIEFKDVTLSYGNVKVLDGISLDIKPGETIGIMGPTGSGKTSLVSLIPRFIDVTSGEVLVDGVNVRDYKMQSLRKHIGITMQDVFLFSDTVESNVAYGVPDTPMENVIASAVIADADEFIRHLPEGYDTIVGERGTGLSGGQKQRISLARAVAKDSPILILDDTTSAVDMETEQNIQERLRARDTKATTIIIAQRVSSVMSADKIIIIEDGKITEQGSHAQLMRNKDGYYRNTCLLQHGAMESDLEGEEAAR